MRSTAARLRISRCRAAPRFWILAAAIAGCGAPDSADSSAAADPPWTTPSITSARAECDADTAEWRFEVVADAWTGNGQVLLSTDGVYAEKHALPSVSAAPDGTRDELALALRVVPDWRDVVLGSTTWFNCATPMLTGILRIWTRDGAEQADCRAFGEAPERWDGWEVGARCDAVLDTTASDR